MRLLRRLLLRGLVVLLAAANAAGVARADMAARDLVRACDPVAGGMRDPTATVPNDLRSGVCIGFFAAIGGVLLFEDDAGRRRLGICTPAHLNALVLLSSTERFLARNPNSMGELAVVVALSAARHDYPCPSVTSSQAR